MKSDASKDHFSKDLWALGCIIYRFFEGMTPFKEKTEMLIFDKILNEELQFSNRTPSVAQNLINSLLDKNPEKRLGFVDMEDLKSHPFFKGIDFEKMTTILPPDESVIQMMTSPLKLKKTISHSKLHILNKDILGLRKNDSDDSSDDERVKEHIDKKDDVNNKESCSRSSGKIFSNNNNNILDDEHAGLGANDNYANTNHHNHHNNGKKAEHKNTMSTIHNNQCNDFNLKYQMRKSGIKRSSKLDIKSSKNINKLYEETLVLECK